MRKAIIGGSGFYDLFHKAEKIEIKTPYGTVQNISKTNYKKHELFFLPRHGSKHSIPPHLINYKANLYALHSLGVEEIIATNAVGSITESIRPGEFVIPDQFIDLTKNRELTYFDGKTTIHFEDGVVRKGVVHLDFTEPYCPRLRSHLKDITTSLGEKVHMGGTYVCFEGPRFETPAEIKMAQQLGGTIVGMTTIPEAVLARELRICYATLCLVTNYGAGMQQQISHTEVVELFNEKGDIIKKIIKEALQQEVKYKNCQCKA